MGYIPATPFSIVLEAEIGIVNIQKPWGPNPSGPPAPCSMRRQHLQMFLRGHLHKTHIASRPQICLTKCSPATRKVYFLLGRTLVKINVSVLLEFCLIEASKKVYRQRGIIQVVLTLFFCQRLTHLSLWCLYFEHPFCANSSVSKCSSRDCKTILEPFLLQQVPSTAREWSKFSSSIPNHEVILVTWKLTFYTTGVAP